MPYATPASPPGTSSTAGSTTPAGDGPERSPTWGPLPIICEHLQWPTHSISPVSFPSDTLQARTWPYGWPDESRLPASSVLHRPSPVTLAGVAALGGPGDLRDFTTYARDICGAPVIEQLLGGGPQQMADRYDQASPLSLLPLKTRQVLIVGADDRVMPQKSRDAYKSRPRGRLATARRSWSSLTLDISR